MTIHNPIDFLWKLLLAAALFVPATRAIAADPANANAPDPTSASTTNDATGVDFFAAMHSGDLDVKFIPRDSKRAQVIIKNTTDQPLTVKLPDAFVGMPVLAQAIGGNGAGNRQTGTGNNNKQNQGVGGGMGGGYGGAFSIPPEKVVKVQVAVVCLDYGKPEPNAHVRYTIVPVERYSKNPEVAELCRMLGDGKLDQRVAQVAAWHLANRMTWDELADLKVFPHFPQYTRPYFSPDEIREAVGVVDQTIKLADARSAETPAATAAKPTTSLPASN